MPLLSIAENLFLGNEIARNGVINWPEAFQKTESLLAKVGLSETPGTQVDKLGVGKQQLIEIAKALAKDVRLLILDEPTAALQENDSQKLLDLMLELKAQGMTQIMISHKLNEISRVADRITVLRDGVHGVDHRPGGYFAKTASSATWWAATWRTATPSGPRIPARVLMEVEGWNVWHPEQADRQMIHDASFHVRKGEIVGIAGLMGTGRTELAMSLFGRSYGRGHTGEVRMNGQDGRCLDRARRRLRRGWPM